MHRSNRQTWLGLLTALAMLLPSRQAAATATIRINEVPEPTQVTNATGTVGLSLITTFTLLDSQNQVLRDFEIDTSTFELGGNTYPASITELDTPWSIVVLVDASRTMGIATAGGAFKNARTALATAAGSIPDGANIAVLRFDDEVPTVQEFTQGKEAVSKAINDLRAKGFGNSCLNDGLYEAVNKLGGAPGRRAVLVFTASADNCANRTPLDVTNLARQNRVQIYAAGLQGYAVTVDTLQALAEPTGGLAELKPESTLGFGLGNLTAVLNNQWSARATVYPSAGAQSATLKINLKDGLSLTSPAISFNSSQDYVPPTEIHLQGTVQSVGNGILFNLNLIEPEKIRQLNVSIIDKSTGQAVMAQALLSFSDVNTIPAVSLVAGQEYTLIVSAVDNSGRVLSEATLDFEYQAPQARLTISEVQSPTPEQPDLLVVVSTLNLEGAVKFRAWLAGGQSNVRLPDTETLVPLGEPILIPTDGLDTGEYTVVVQALDSSDTVLAESPPVKTGYTRPGAFASIRRTLSDNPLLIAGLTAVLCVGVIGALGVVFLILPRRGRRAEAVDLVMPQKARRAAPQTEKVPDRRPTPPRGTPRAEPPAAAPKPAPPKPAPAAPPPAQRQPAPPPKPAAPPPAQRQPAPPPKPPAPPPVQRQPEPDRHPLAEPAPRAPEGPAQQAPAAPAQRAPEGPAQHAPAAPAQGGVQSGAGGQVPAAIRSQSMRALPAARLSLIDPASPQFGIEMKHSPFTIGRRTGSDAVVPVDSASGVSGSHLTLIFEDGKYFALDEKSTYGTTVNGQSLTKGQRFLLPDGAVIGLGPKVKLQFWFSPKP